MPPRLRWHMIGHLQRNKVKPVLSIVDLIHSIDSLRLAEELDAQAAKMGRKVSVLLQVNASEEESKHGVAVGASVHLAEQMDSMPNLQFIGLMTMAPLEGGQESARRCFARTREIARTLPRPCILENRVMLHSPVVDRRAAHRIEQVAPRSARERAERDRRIWHAESGEPDLRYRRAGDLRHDPERIHV